MSGVAQHTVPLNYFQLCYVELTVAMDFNPLLNIIFESLLFPYVVRKSSRRLLITRMHIVIIDSMNIFVQNGYKGAVCK